MGAGDVSGEEVRASKRFFFEKKKQKTHTPRVPGCGQIP
jgi:hypothetical protein